MLENTVGAGFDTPERPGSAAIFESYCLEASPNILTSSDANLNIFSLAPKSTFSTIYQTQIQENQT